MYSSRYRDCVMNGGSAALGSRRTVPSEFYLGSVRWSVGRRSLNAKDEQSSGKADFVVS